MASRDQRLVQGGADQAGSQDQHAQRRSLLLRTLCSGSLASVLSTVAVSIFSRRHCGATAAGTNAASQWIWYPRARHVARPSPMYTLSGYAIHHASSLLWGGVYETTRLRQAALPGRVARAAGVATLAYVVDYHLVPRRFSPGFEHRIGAAGMCAAYAAFAVGLLLASRPRKARPARVARTARRLPGTAPGGTGEQ